MKEMWRVIPGMPRYMVSNYGRVKNTKTEKIIKGQLLNGSMKVDILLDNGKHRKFRVDFLIKAAFGLGCDRGQYSEMDERYCDKAVECWHCGLNKEVEYERKQDIRRHGLTKDPDGLLRYHVRNEYELRDI